MYRAARRDSNEPAVIAVAKKCGASVIQLDNEGVPDLLLGFRGQNILIEVKTEKGKLTPAQEIFFRTWKGTAVVIRSPEAMENYLTSLVLCDKIIREYSYGRPYVIC